MMNYSCQLGRKTGVQLIVDHERFVNGLPSQICSVLICEMLTEFYSSSTKTPEVSSSAHCRSFNIVSTCSWIRVSEQRHE